ncbi:hypothetical protein ES708_10892 [subsurface metagenome]
MNMKFEFEEEREKVTFTQKQITALKILNRKHVRGLLFGGAKGGGKSVLLCRYAWLYCKTIIKHFDIPVLRSPLPIFFMGRLQGVDFDDTTLETWKEYIPEADYTIKEKNKEIIIENRVKIQYGGLDNKKVVKKFNSANYGAFGLDQAEEIDEDKLTELRLTLRRSIGGIPLPFKEVYTANPADCWLKDQFVLGHNKRFVFLPSLPSDNSFLPADYVPNMEYTLRNRPELLKAYRDGSWDILAGADIVIQDKWIERANENKFHVPIRRVIVCDVATYGDDESVIYCMENSNIIKSRIFGKKDEYYIANEMENLGLDFKPSLYAVDSIGVGSGVVSILNNKGLPVLAINAAEKQESGVPKHFLNRRAQIWWNAGDLFSNNDVELHHDDQELKRQLTVPRYTYKGDKFMIRSRDEIKKSYGRSIDRASAYVMGLWALQYCEVIEEKHNRPEDFFTEEDLGLDYMSA